MKQVQFFKQAFGKHFMAGLLKTSMILQQEKMSFSMDTLIRYKGSFSQNTNTAISFDVISLKFPKRLPEKQSQIRIIKEH